MSSKPKTRGIPPIALYISGFLDLFGVSMIIPLIMSHCRYLGASPTVNGILGSTYGALQLFSSPVIGSWSDIQGRQFTLLVCLLMSGVGYSIFSIAKTVTVVFIARIHLGIFKHSQSITKAYLVESTIKAQQSTVLGHFNAVSSLGFILGPAVGGNLAERPQGFYLVATLTGCIFFLNACIIWLWRKTTETTPTETSSSKKFEEINFSLTQFLTTLKDVDWRDLWDVYLIKFVLGVSVIMFWSNFSLMLVQKFGTSPATNGYIISFKSTVAALVGFVTGRITNIYSSNAKLLLHLALAQSLTLLGLGLSLSLWVFVAGLIPLSFVTTIARVAGTSLSMERSKREDIGLLLGFQQSIMSIARMLAPLVAGVTMEMSPSMPGIIGAVFSFSAVIIMVIRPQDPRERQKKLQ